LFGGFKYYDARLLHVVDSIENGKTQDPTQT